MVINIRMRGLSISQALSRHFEHRLGAATRPFRGAVVSVTAWLTDINGRRGGNDKRCRLVAVLPRRRHLVTEGLHADAYTSIEQAADKMQRAISHLLGRQPKRGRRATKLISPGQQDI